MAFTDMSCSKKKRSRPCESKFNADVLIEHWDPIARLKDPGIAWDGSSYGSSRTQSLDEATMLPYAKALEHLLGLAPGGFPCHRALLGTLKELHVRHSILRADPLFVHRAASSWGRQLEDHDEAFVQYRHR